MRKPPVIKPTLACSVLGTLGYFHMTCMCSALCPVSEHCVMFFLPAPLVWQTGEFSACFLLKLPVDFSNIPVYLLKVMTSTHIHYYTHTNSIQRLCIHKNKTFPSHRHTCKHTNGRLTHIMKIEKAQFVWWVCAKCAQCVCVYAGMCVLTGRPGSELTNQQPVTTYQL